MKSFRPSRGRGVSTPRRFGTRGRSRNSSEHIDVSRFINKSVITETVEKFVPEHSFLDFKLEKLLEKNIVDKGYLDPTPIQDKSIPHILRGEDIVGIANTGTGKTAAFLIPLINKIIINPNEKILVVVPTRELANQIEDELRMFGKGSGLFSVLCIGGAGIGKQIRELAHRHHFVIGTPGRLKDLVEQKKINLASFKTIVLDEADRMLDMGFIRDIRFLVERMPSPRHTLFFSATISREIEKLIGEFLRNPVHISVKTGNTSKNVHQDIVRIPAGKTKMDVLVELLRDPDFNKVIVFAKTKHGVEKLSVDLNKLGINSVSIHGNKRQRERQQALDFFKNGRTQALIATDVAARGLDISGVSHVINFDLPATYDDYIHRIGRTGRGGMTGKALTFV